MNRYNGLGMVMAVTGSVLLFFGVEWNVGCGTPTTVCSMTAGRSVETGIGLILVIVGLALRITFSSLRASSLPDEATPTTNGGTAP